MHAILTVSERQKIEKDISGLVSNLSEAVACGDSRIRELEKLLEQQSKKAADAEAQFGAASKANKDFEAQITALKEELGARNADISVLNLEIKTLGKDVDSLQRQHTEAAEEAKGLRDMSRKPLASSAASVC